MTASQELLDSLNADLMKEHGAIIQYLIHSAQVRDSELRYTLSQAAREEMWHMEWLYEAINERGGEATLERQEGIVTAEGPVGNFEADVRAEEDALSHYEETLALIGDSDEELTRLVERIMDDERHHRTSFVGATHRLREGDEAAYVAKPEIEGADIPAAAPALNLEYEGLLQYLVNKYGVGEEEGELAETYFELAINEMRHLVWVASCYGSLTAGPPPPVPLDRVTKTSGPAEARARAEEYEAHAAKVVASVREQVTGPAVAQRMRRIEYQHGYHRFQLEHLEPRGDA